MKEDREVIPKEWLVERVDVLKAEIEGQVDGTPWELIRRRMQPGDEVWLYGSPAGNWENIAGRQGVVIVRDGRAVEEFLGIQT